MKPTRQRRTTKVAKARKKVGDFRRGLLVEQLRQAKNRMQGNLSEKKQREIDELLIHAVKNWHIHTLQKKKKGSKPLTRTQIRRIIQGL